VSLDRVIYCVCYSIFFGGGAFYPDTVYYRQHSMLAEVMWYCKCGSHLHVRIRSV